MNTYFDTSVIVKLAVEEEGTTRALALWDASELVVTSRLSYAEARAALAAAHRARKLPDHELIDAKRMLEVLFQAMDLIEVTERIVRDAGDIAERYGLRGYDAVHLASAFVRGTEVVVATWDATLARAAQSAGFRVTGRHT